MASQSLGASCHSSISLGVSPSNKTEASISAICRLVSNEAGLSIYRILLAYCSAVVVFPHHLGPSIKIAPLLANFFASIWSAILCLYSIFQIFVDSHAKIQLFFNISSVGWILFPQLAEFCFLSWPYFVSSIG